MMPCLILNWIMNLMKMNFLMITQVMNMNIRKMKRFLKRKSAKEKISSKLFLKILKKKIIKRRLQGSVISMSSLQRL